MTYYYQVAVRGSVGDKDVFTYQSDMLLRRGQLVQVSLKGKLRIGAIWGEQKRPPYKTLPIANIFETVLTNQSLNLITWLADFYAANLSTCLQLCLPDKIDSNPKPRLKERTATIRPDTSQLLPTKEQATALESLFKLRQGSALVHGETGSGKTRVYAELAKRYAAEGKSVLILVPEIGMTHQLESEVEPFIDAHITIYHSAQTPAQRRKAWQTAVSGQQMVIIGTRSALFLPIQKLGLVIVDECHDSAYKHDASPRYNANRVASQLALLHRGLVVFGTATPNITDYHLAISKKALVLHMTRQASGVTRNVSPTLVDKRDRSTFTTSQLLSTKAIKAIRQSLEREEQVLLFLNRRGTAKICLCQNCGWNAGCDDCDMPLTYHRHNQQLLCHSCGRNYPLVTTCPVCGSVELSYQSPGVQALETEVARLFPGYRSARIDSDTKQSEGLSAIYDELYSGDIPILIGTQSIAKGLDLPKLALEVLVDADTSLHLPDYLAGERMFQLLYQVMGRVGRHRAGQVIIQTVTPEHPVLLAAIQRDFNTFYEKEIAARQALDYPPFSHLARIVVEAGTEATCSRRSYDIAKLLSREHSLRVRGPSPCYYPKLRGKYRYQLLISATRRSTLTKLKELIPAHATLDIDPTNLL